MWLAQHPCPPSKPTSPHHPQQTGLWFYMHINLQFLFLALIFLFHHVFYQWLPPVYPDPIYPWYLEQKQKHNFFNPTCYWHKVVSLMVPTICFQPSEKKDKIHGWLPCRALLHSSPEEQTHNIYRKLSCEFVWSQSVAKNMLNTNNT